MANRSRVKTEEEYSNILGSKVEDKDLKVTHDASRYFDELRDSHVQEENNPFEKKVSMEDLKSSLKEKYDSVNVSQIKEEIAKIQVEITPEEVNIPLEKTKDTEIRRFSFEENARKLYENLRESKVAPVYEREVSLEPNDVKDNTIEIVEPVTVDKERIEVLEQEVVTQPEIVEEEVIEPTIVEPELVEPEVIIEPELEIPVEEEVEPIDLTNFEEDIISEDEAEIEELDFSELELTADFTKENENFLEAIGIDSEPKAQLPQEPLFTPLTEVEEEEEFEDEFTDFEEEPTLDGLDEKETMELDADLLNTFYSDDSLMDILNTQEDEVDYSTMANEKDLISQISDISEDSDFESHLKELNKKPVSRNLTDTLTMALDDEKSISVSPNEIRELKEEDFRLEDEVPKRKIGDTIITVLLVVMILVVAYLLFRMLSG